MALLLNPDFNPRHGEAVEVAPGVRRVTARNAGPYTFLGTNSFLVGQDPAAVIDPGPGDPAHIEALRRAIGGARVSHILVTHAHRDHCEAVPRLKSLTGAPVLARAPRRRSGPERLPAKASADAPPEAGFRPDKILSDGGIVKCGSFEIETVATPGHSPDHAAYALAGRGILFSGDHVMGWSTTMVAPPEGSMAEYMRSLDRLIERPEHLYLPAHGAEIREPHAHMRALKAHRKMRERAILDALNSGVETVPELVARIYPDLQPERRGAAALSTLAHLEDLVARALVRSSGEPALVARYRPAVVTPPGVSG